VTLLLFFTVALETIFGQERADLSFEELALLRRRLGRTKFTGTHQSRHDQSEQNLDGQLCAHAIYLVYSNMFNLFK
jgi:hypothetical protein